MFTRTPEPVAEVRFLSGVPSGKSALPGVFGSAFFALTEVLTEVFIVQGYWYQSKSSLSITSVDGISAFSSILSTVI